MIQLVNYNKSINSCCNILLSVDQRFVIIEACRLEFYDKAACLCFYLKLSRKLLNRMSFTRRKRFKIIISRVLPFGAPPPGFQITLLILLTLIFMGSTEHRFCMSIGIHCNISQTKSSLENSWSSAILALTVALVNLIDIKFCYWSGQLID